MSTRLGAAIANAGVAAPGHIFETNTVFDTHIE
jgi:hypothetical protein